MLNVNRTHIEISHKLKCHGNNSSLIIVKFLSHKVKTGLYKERVKLRHVLFCHLPRKFHGNGQGGDHEELLQANGPHARTRENVEKLSSGSAFRIVLCAEEHLRASLPWMPKCYGSYGQKYKVTRTSGTASRQTRPWSAASKCALCR